MAAPTFVAEYESSWSASQQTLTTSVTTEVGDVLVVGSLTQNSNAVPGTPTGGTGLTWTLQQSVSVSTSWGGAYVWTATATAAETFTLSITAGGPGAQWGFNCLRFSGAGGVGASGKANASGAPSLELTTTQDDSAVVAFVCDWNASDGTSRAWVTDDAGTLTEDTYYRNTSWYTVYGGHYADAGAAGAKTVGLSTPTQKYSMVAVEVLGTPPPPITSPFFHISGGELVPMTITML